MPIAQHVKQLPKPAGIGWLPQIGLAVQARTNPNLPNVAHNHTKHNVAEKRPSASRVQQANDCSTELPRSHPLQRKKKRPDPNASRIIQNSLFLKPPEYGCYSRRNSASLKNKGILGRLI
jgi:hypothetical protein